MRDIDYWAKEVQDAEDGYASLTHQHAMPTSTFEAPASEYTVQQLLDMLSQVKEYDRNFTVSFVDSATGKEHSAASFRLEMNDVHETAKLFYNFR